MSSNLCIGIDLGTTNSVLATVNIRPNGNIISKVVDIPRPIDVYSSVTSETRLSTEKKATLPSCVFYRQEKNYEPLVGDFAKLQYALRPHLVAKSIKSQMGRAYAEGLSPDVPDKTPAEIASRILKHMLNEASKVYRTKITDAVITVPANFDPSMCKATLDAAELAGIKVRNSDGSERPVLLSEPKAVIYDLINRIHNGEISDLILDLSSMKRVLVFDLGGGTLDITMHEIRRRGENSEILKVDEIATNRYTLLGGDNFDEAIAQSMFERYIKQYERNPSVVSQLSQKHNIIMAQLRTYAENVKLDLSMQCMENSAYGSSGWDDYDSDSDSGIRISTGGSMGSIGYPYDDTFTKDEIESILNQFMGRGLSYNDYKNLSEITDTHNIIYPILDVLKKASDELNTPDVKVDAVIVNGGMSKFYMITDRLRDFFGIEPIVALDPDQSVATGAAVYHYLLTQHSELQDDMTMPGISERSSEPPKVAVEWSRPKLNDALYIGMRNHSVQEIIPTGAELPYDSKIMTGFTIEPMQKRINIPIKSRNLDGKYRTISSGDILFSQVSSDKLYVAFKIHMEASKIISMTAWTSYDLEGNDKIETGQTQIAVTNTDKPTYKVQTLISSSSRTGGTGIALDAHKEINRLVQLCRHFVSVKISYQASSTAQKIRELTANIIAASNRSDFKEPVFAALANPNVNDEAKMRLFTLARRIANIYAPGDLSRLAAICMSYLAPTIRGFHAKGARVSSNNEAIYTLSICGNQGDMKCLAPLHDKYFIQCLYAHAKTRTAVDWILSRLSSDAASTRIKPSNIMQTSAYAAAVALKNGADCKASLKQREKALNEIISAVKSRRLLISALSNCIVALGTICDSRTQASPFSSIQINEVEQCIDSIAYDYPDLADRVERNCDVALKLIHGENLSDDEEKFLLTKLELDI